MPSYLVLVNGQPYIREALPAAVVTTETGGKALVLVQAEQAAKFNPHHDERGRFAHGEGGGGGAASESAWDWSDGENREATEYGHSAKPGWEDTISEDEKGAVRAYTGSDTSERINASLWSDQPLSETDAQTVRHLDAVIEKAGTFDQPVTVWRGIRPTHKALPPGAELAGRPAVEREAMIRKSVADYAERTYQPGSVLEMKGFQSCSFGPDAPLAASVTRDNVGVVFEIRTRKGAFITPLSRYDDEGELLMARDSRFRVRKVLREVTFVQTMGTEVPRTVVQVEAID